jgi:hypothetical protein
MIFIDNVAVYAENTVKSRVRACWTFCCMIRKGWIACISPMSRTTEIPFERIFLPETLFLYILLITSVMFLVCLCVCRLLLKGPRSCWISQLQDKGDGCSKTLCCKVSVPGSSLKTSWQEPLMKPFGYSLCVSSFDCVKHLNSSHIPNTKSRSRGSDTGLPMLFAAVRKFRSSLQTTVQSIWK